MVLIHMAIKLTYALLFMMELCRRHVRMIVKTPPNRIEFSKCEKTNMSKVRPKETMSKESNKERKDKTVGFRSAYQFANGWVGLHILSPECATVPMM